MCIWWNNIRSNNNNKNLNKIDHNKPKQENPNDSIQSDLTNRQINKTNVQCITKSVNTIKSYHIRSIDYYTFWMHSMYSIFLIWSLNVIIVAIANDSFSILNSSQQQPCDRSRRVFTDLQGEISDGPTGFNYTQVSILH